MDILVMPQQLGCSGVRQLLVLLQDLLHLHRGILTEMHFTASINKSYAA